MALRHLAVEVRSSGSCGCDTECTECAPVIGVTAPELTVSGNGVLAGAIVPREVDNVATWSAGGRCFANFEFDDVQLVPNTELDTCDVCLLCGCIVRYLQQLNISDNFSVADTTSIDMSLLAGVVSAVAKVSGAAGNQVSIAADGLLVPRAAGLLVTDSSSIDLSVVAGVLSAVSLISATPDNQISIAGDGLLVPKAAGLTVSDTATVDLTVAAGNLTGAVKISADVGNIITQHADGIFAEDTGGGGGPCINEVTTVAFNALVAGAGLTPGCTYVITDHQQNRVPMGTRVTLTAISEDQITPQCAVVTSYDARPWRGTYDAATNKLVELWDNQGNYASNYPSNSATYSCVDNFDWGNTNYTNCYVAQATLSVTYGATGIVDRLRLEGDSSLSLSNWTGSIIKDTHISGASVVNLNNGNAEFTSVQIKGASSVSIQSNVALGGNSISDIDNTVIDGLAFIRTVAGTALRMHDSYVIGESSILVDGAAWLIILSSSATNLGQIHVPVGGSGGAAPTNFLVDWCSVQNGSSIRFLGASTQSVSVQNCFLTSSSVLDFTAITVAPPVTGYVFESLTLATGAEVHVTTPAARNGIISYLQVEQGIFNNSGYDITDVYVRGAGTKTATAANTGKGKDYFNDNIV